MRACIFANNRNCSTSDCPLQWTYNVISKSGRLVKILMKGKVETVTIDRVKPVHFKRKPESDKMTQRQTKPISTTPKPAAIARGPRRNRVRSSSTLTPQSIRTGVGMNTSTQSLRCSKLAQVRQLLYSLIWLEHVRLDQRHLIKCRTLEPLLFLALKGTVVVCERTHVYLYT